MLYSCGVSNYPCLKCAGRTVQGKAFTANVMAKTDKHRHWATESNHDLAPTGFTGHVTAAITRDLRPIHNEYKLAPGPKLSKRIAIDMCAN